MSTVTRSSQEPVLFFQRKKKDEESPPELIYTQGTLEPAEDSLADPDCGVAQLQACKLRRKVEMWQNYTASKSTTTKDSFGGGETTTTEESLRQKWSETALAVRMSQSTSLMHGGGVVDDNPPFPMTSTEYKCDVYLGAYCLCEEQVDMLNDWKDVKLPTPPPPLLERFPQGGIKHEDEYYFAGKGTITHPNVGDIRISYSYVPAGECSVIAKRTEEVKSGKILLSEYTDPHPPYTLPWICCGCCFGCCNNVGRTESDINLVMTGLVPKDEMWKQAQSMNKLKLHILRVVGFLMFFIGFILVLDPIATVLDVVSFLGDLSRILFVLASFLISTALTLLVIAFAWLMYRPLVAMMLFAMVAVLGVGISLLST